MSLLPMGGEDRNYEVSFFDNAGKKRCTLGWAATPAGAESLCGSVRLHPGRSDPRVKICGQVPVAVAPAPEKTPSVKRSYE